MASKICIFLDYQKGLISIKDLKPLTYTCNLALDQECPHISLECPRHNMNKNWRLKYIPN